MRSFTTTTANFFLLAFFIFFLSSGLISSSSAFQTRKGGAYLDKETNKFYFKAGDAQQPEPAAFGTFEDSLNVTGWGVLRIKTSPHYSDEQQMFAAGFLEGSLTPDHIFEEYKNVYYSIFGAHGKPGHHILSFLAQQDEWVRQQILENPQDELWTQVGLLMAQFDGLVAGYATASPSSNQLPWFGFTLLSASNDIPDLQVATTPLSQRVDWRTLTPEELKRRVMKSSRCSAIVKLTAGLEELYTSHSTWFSYSTMNRIYKNYHFHLRLHSSTPSPYKISFSSYPGFLLSSDDFYITSLGLVIMETTNDIFDNSLYDKVVPQSLFSWQRMRIASAMAKNGQEWYKIFASYNSGTYNNQYMVVDYNKFSPKQDPANGTLWIIEQIPGLVYGEDKTDVLRFGYWPSYNIPYFPIIYKMSGYPAVYAKNGDDYSYELAPRAKIFHRDQAKAEDLPSLQDLMRYNNYKKDPYSKKQPSDSICARGDLDPSSPDAYGCLDSKITTSQLVPQLDCYAISGPTTSNGLPPFSWDDFSDVPHYGQPTLWNFDFQFIPFEKK